MGLLWYVGQLGIIVEAVGAGLGVLYVWQTKRHWQDVVRVNPDGTTTSDATWPMLHGELMGQFPKQMRVFALITIGLLLQFIGNFAK